jgi:outer membrane protein assembly factor BamB
VAIIAPLLFATKAIAHDWPQFLGPARNGVYSDHDIAADWPAEGPPTVWKTDVGHGFAGPVISNGKLILFHRVGEKERVECFDPASGKSLWVSDYVTDYSDDFGFDNGPRSTPTVVDHRIYTFGAAGMLACRELETGRQIWSIDTAKQFHSPKGFFGRACSPLVEGKVVIVNVGAEGAGIVGFDKETGRILWKTTDDAASYSSPIASIFEGKRYALVLTRAGLVALDPDSGKLIFMYPFRSRSEESVNAATPLVIDDTIFLSASYGTGATLLKFDREHPKSLWAADGVLSNHYATCVCVGGFLYGFNGRQEHGPSLTCVELKTGKARWSEENFGAGSIMLAGGNLLILTEKGELIRCAATPDAFRPSAKAQVLPFNTRAYPALANGYFFARGESKLVCLDLRDKKAK